MFNQTKKMRWLKGNWYMILALTMFALFMFVPEVTFAGSVTETLRDEPGIKAMWKFAINIVNIFVTAILIVVAFTEILNIKVDAYRIKKLLPALIFAVIAANFSFILVRFLVDISNVILSVFVQVNVDINDITNKGIGATKQEIYDSFASTSSYGLAPEFNWFGTDKTAGEFWGNIFRNILAIIFAFASTLAILGLVFLFWIRTWVIYALTIAAPIAFMAMVLPPTKKMFDQWWSMLLKWTFMPVPSIALIWLGARLLSILAPSFTFPLMAYVFAVACLYGALIVPFALGGGIMDKFFTYTGAKHVTDNAKKYWKNRGLTALKTAGWRWSKAGLDTQRGSSGLAKFLKSTLGEKNGEALSGMIGRNWIGTGLAKSEADLKHAEQMAKGIEEGTQARYYYNKGDKFQMEREYNRNRDGEIGEFEKYAILRIAKKGMDAAKINETDKDYEQLKEWRLGSGLARRRMETADQFVAGLIADGTTSAVNGYLVDKSEAVIQRQEQIKKEVDDDATIAAADKERVKQERLDEYNKERKAEWLKVSGFSEAQEKALREQMTLVVTSKESSELLKAKAEKDMLQKAAMQMVAIHELQEMTDEVKKTEKLFAKMPEDAKSLFREISAGTKKLEKLEETDRAIYESQAEYLTQKARADTLLYKHGILDTGKTFIGDGEGIDGVSTTISEKVQSRATEYLAQLTETDPKKKGILASGVPAYLKGLVDVDSSGKVIGFKKMERTTFTRFQSVAGTKTAGRVDDYAELPVDSLMNILAYGDKKDGIREEQALAFRNGESVGDPNKVSRLSAAWLAAQRQLSHGVNAGTVARGVLGILGDDSRKAIANEWVASEAGKLKVKDATTGEMVDHPDIAALKSAIESGGNALHEAMHQFYTNRLPNQRTDINGALSRHMPQARYS